MSQAKTTTDHEEIRRWAEKHGGRPSRVKSSGDEGGILRLDFGDPEPNLEQISWDEFFETFDDRELAFLYQDEKSSRFNKFVNRRQS